jgi:hypothetical protein
MTNLFFYCGAVSSAILTHRLLLETLLAVDNCAHPLDLFVGSCQQLEDAWSLWVLFLFERTWKP